MPGFADILNAQQEYEALKRAEEEAAIAAKVKAAWDAAVGPGQSADMPITIEHPNLPVTQMPVIDVTDVKRNFSPQLPAQPAPQFVQAPVPPQPYDSGVGLAELLAPSTTQPGRPQLPGVLERGTIDPYRGMLDPVAMQGDKEFTPTPPPAAALPGPAPTPEAFQAAPRGVAASPPATAEEFQARVSGWEKFKQTLSRPDVIGPLQTFFAAVAAPLAPGENMGSRMGRASMLAQMHQTMLHDNEKNAEYLLQTQRAELQQKQANVEGKQLANKGQGLSNTQTEAGMAWELSKKASDARLGTGKAENQTREQNDAHALSAAQTNRLNNPVFAPDRSGGHTKAVEAMTMDEMLEEVNSLTQAFRGSGGDLEEGASFPEWVQKNYGASQAQRINKITARIQASGGVVNWKGRPLNAERKPVTGSKRYTLDAEGNLK